MLVSKKNKELIAEWKKAKANLDIFKERESKLRDQIVDKIFAKRVEGNNSAELGHGFRINCKQGYKYNVDESLLKDALRELPRGIKKKLIQTKVSLIKKGYKELDEDLCLIFDNCLTLTPSKPQLEIVQPKKEN